MFYMFYKESLAISIAEQQGCMVRSLAPDCMKNSTFHFGIFGIEPEFLLSNNIDVRVDASVRIFFAAQETSARVSSSGKTHLPFDD